jgi:hypothetical protein
MLEMRINRLEKLLSNKNNKHPIAVSDDYLQSNSTSYLKSGLDKYCSFNCGGNGIVVVKDNFTRACLVHTIRQLITTNWYIDKDSYFINKNISEYPLTFINDCIVYSLFSSYVVSLKQSDLICKNELFLYR